MSLGPVLKLFLVDFLLFIELKEEEENKFQFFVHHLINAL